jgi:hypothetical protein
MNTSAGFFLTKKINQAFTWMKGSEQPTTSHSSIEYTSFPLNAYLTYVNLSIQAIMQGMNEDIF